MNDVYLVWSNEHRGWWRANRCGYTTGLEAAGRYSRDEALAICRNAIPQAFHMRAIAEIPVLLADVEAFLAGQQFIPDAITKDTGYAA